jgi:translation initiation factor 2 gamma subunit (eIF-2gamma)
MHTLNIGILAHVDAGKTSLTERLLFDHGAIDRLGSVDAGDTRTDDGTIERQRGITIRSAVAAFTCSTARCCCCPPWKASRHRPASCCGPCGGYGCPRSSSSTRSTGQVPAPKASSRTSGAG